MDQSAKETNGNRIVLVTGPSGAGRSTTINVLEDAGFEAIDNLPLSLLPRLLDGPPLLRPMALGIDVRNRDFSATALIEMIDKLRDMPNLTSELLYIDCRTDVLLRRYSETRRRHPMAPGESPEQGITRELDLLAPIRARADVLLDTSNLTPHDLRADIEKWYAPGGIVQLAISIHSFSYKRGLPRGIDMVFDCRFLRNPYWDESLRAMTGQSSQVADYIAADDRFTPFFDHVNSLAQMLLPAYIDEGKAHFSIGFGCTGGQHRSVAVAEQLAKALADADWQVSIRHRELERHAGAAVAQER
ncbi:RNase adapter RapZ [Parasulfitobacter algicola]|uniref:RNase adapter RapZ n=1 Tax=Parasulfitobacter algicola TaxID=2614809 RepID=A0ABX2INP1_9RHOB|nr:RNase adapter RapZ [Sulfitobacter algicola]NSX54497.1 RNase adapter RapZ [Sulfitobacter algicola]